MAWAEGHGRGLDRKERTEIYLIQAKCFVRPSFGCLLSVSLGYVLYCCIEFNKLRTQITIDQARQNERLIAICSPCYGGTTEQASVDEGFFLILWLDLSTSTSLLLLFVGRYVNLYWCIRYQPPLNNSPFTARLKFHKAVRFFARS